MVAELWQVFQGPSKVVAPHHRGHTPQASSKAWRRHWIQAKLQQRSQDEYMNSSWFNGQIKFSLENLHLQKLSEREHLFATFPASVEAATHSFLFAHLSLLKRKLPKAKRLRGILQLMSVSMSNYTKLPRLHFWHLRSYLFVTALHFHYPKSSDLSRSISCPSGLWKAGSYLNIKLVCWHEKKPSSSIFLS